MREEEIVQIKESVNQVYDESREGKPLSKKIVGSINEATLERIMAGNSKRKRENR